MPASTPQEIHFLFERAFNTGDVEAILALYEPGAVLVAGGKPVTGHDCIRDAACARWVTCATKVRTVSNCVVWPAAKMPCVGAKLYLSAGIAFAAPTTWNSIMESKLSTAFAGSSFVPTGGDGGDSLICARICIPPLTITATARIRARIRIVYPRSKLV